MNLSAPFPLRGLHRTSPRHPRTPARAALAALAVVPALLLAPAPARGAGLYFADRGVRPAGRAGAFIAGADDLGAIAYNIAGIYDAGSQILFDASWLRFSSDYTRQSYVRQVDPNTGATTATFLQTYEEVSGESPFVPIPTLAVSLQPHPKWVVALGAWAPYAAIASYPEQPAAPQRYSLFSLEGSALAFIGAGAAFAPSKEWRIGAAIGVLAGNFNTRVAVSGCVPERFLCAPEDPEWDVLSELSVGPIVAPTGQAGVIWIPDPKWRVGLSFQAPVYVRASATVRARLPATPIFEQAYQEGEDADVEFDLPWNLRVGVETRVIDNLRLELGAGFERWSMHDTITIDPDGMTLKDVAAFPETYSLPTIDFPRNFQDSVSVRLGGEYSFQLLDHSWEGRAGMSFETSAVPAEYLSVLTIDSSKVTTALGLGVHVGQFRFDAVYAHIFASGVDVDPKAARIAQISPVDANAPKNPNYINGGSYSASADVIGLGVAYTFEPAPVDADAPAPKAAEPKATPPR